MDWSKGYSSRFYMSIVDPSSWRDTETIKITGGKVSRSSDGLMQSADVECNRYDQTRERYVRIYMDIDQGGAHAHVPIFTGLATSPDRDIDGRAVSHSVACYSVLKPCDDIALPRGWYAPQGGSGAQIVGRLLSVSPAPVSVEGESPTLVAPLIAEDGETNLSMVWKILEAINWRLRINGNGEITVEPKPTESAVTFDPLEFDVLETKLSVTKDWYSCPNVLMCICDDFSAVVRDDDIESPLSIETRGREVWNVETDCDISSGESIGAYAKRRLKELQTVQKEISYDRRYVPEVYPGDVVTLHYPEQELVGDFRIESQSITLGYSARTSERASEVM